MIDNIKSFPVYRVKFERLTSVMERIATIFWFWDSLGRICGCLLTGGGPGSIRWFFNILRQNFWGISVIGLYNHRKTLPHLTPLTGINKFNWPNRSKSIFHVSICLHTSKQDPFHAHNHTQTNYIYIYIY